MFLCHEYKIRFDKNSVHCTDLVRFRGVTSHPPPETKPQG